MSAPEEIQSSEHNSFDPALALSKVEELVLTSTPEVLRAVQHTVEGLGSESSLGGLQGGDQKSAARLLAMLLTLSGGDPDGLIRFRQLIETVYLSSETNEKDAADVDATMEDAEDAPNQVAAKASLGGMNSPERPAGNPQDEGGNEGSDADQDMEVDARKTLEEQRNTPNKRKRKSGSRDANYKSRQNPRKKPRRDRVTESKSQNDSSEDPDEDSDSSASTERQRQENSRHNASKHLSRSKMSPSTQRKADGSPVTALGSGWDESHYLAMCEAVSSRAKELKWDQKKQDSAYRLVCGLVLSSAAENIATNVVRFAIAGVHPQHNGADPATSQAITVHTEQPELIRAFISWSNFWTYVEGLSEWGKHPQTQATFAAFSTNIELEEQIKAGNQELITFLQHAVPGASSPAVALNQYLTPRSPWGKATSREARYHQKHRANMEYVFLEALGGPAALLLCSKNSSLRSVLGNLIQRADLLNLLEKIRDSLSALRGLVETLNRHVWEPLNQTQFQLPVEDINLEPLLTELQDGGWDGVVDAIVKARRKVLEERSKFDQDEAMEGIESGDGVDGADGVLSGLGGFGVDGAALEEAETAGGQSYFDEAMAEGGKEADIPNLDAMALNNTI